MARRLRVSRTARPTPEGEGFPDPDPAGADVAAPHCFARVPDRAECLTYRNRCRESQPLRRRGEHGSLRGGGDERGVPAEDARGVMGGWWRPGGTALLQYHIWDLELKPACLHVDGDGVAVLDQCERAAVCGFR